MRKLFHFLRVTAVASLCAYAILQSSSAEATVFNLGSFWKKKTSVSLNTWTAMPCGNVMPIEAMSSQTDALMLIYGFSNGSTITANGTGFSVIGSLLGCPTTDFKDMVSFYDPTLKTWTTKSQTSLINRWGGAAVLAGTKAIIWGGTTDGSTGSSLTTTGVVYNISTDTWSSTSLVSVPTKRSYPVTAWTGSKVIIWGGYDGGWGATTLSTGALYDPSTDTWTAMSNTSAPLGGSRTSVWTGSKLVVWGGLAMTELNTGGRYDPSTNTWATTSTTSVPAARRGHSAVWTGTQMIVWGGISSGSVVGNGGRYNPSTNAWATMSSTNAPSARTGHSAVWTGTKMIVWGGTDGTNALSSGGIYDPATDTWTTMTSAPFAARAGAYTTAYGLTMQKVAYVGTKMAVWTGTVSGIGLYDTATNTWSTYDGTAPGPIYGGMAVWAGSKMVVPNVASGMSGFNNGGIFDPTTQLWSPISSTNAFVFGSENSFIGAGTKAIAWGGRDSNSALITGGSQYDVATDTWSSVGTSGAPAARGNHSAVWSGSKMIIWGGNNDSNSLNTGGLYDPGTGLWTSTTTTGAPAARATHFAGWTGTKMLIYGGVDYSGNPLTSGGLYDPTGNSWTTISTTGAPSTDRTFTAMVMGGTKLFLWGGTRPSDGTFLYNGYIYDSVANTWSTMTATNAPATQSYANAFWTGSKLIVWGGADETNAAINTGAVYNPGTNTWTAMTLTNAPTPRAMTVATWSGSKMIIFGGISSYILNLIDGAIYAP